MTTLSEIARTQRGNAAGVDFLRRPGSASATPLVLLHGIGSNAESFAALMAAMPSGMDVIAWDAPGYGQSARPAPASPAPRDYASRLAALLDALEVKNVVLAGHSLGSLFAGSFAVHFPQRVRALALMSPALGYKVAAGDTLPPSVQARIDEIETLGPAAFAAKRASRLVGDPQANPGVVAAVEKAMAAVNPPGYAQAVRALGAGDLLSDAATIEAPTLVAVGTKDVVTPPENAQKLYGALRNPAGFHAVAGAGHALPQEQPETAARILAKFAAEHAHG
jgi:pimeloyl-ACP methyl ester carboxylesterase